MKNYPIILLLILPIIFLKSAEGQLLISTGLDYRQYPIDIEDVPRGPQGSNGLSRDSRFWQVTSIKAGLGIDLKNNWQFSLTTYSRYNHLHWLQGVNLATPRSEKRKQKKNFKYDCFLDIEKRVRLKENKERYFTVLAGLGFTNLNSRFSVFLQDTLPTGPTAGQLYEGTYQHFGPRISLGYQYEKIKASIDTYIIEGPDLNNLTSLWIGASISYEFGIRKWRKINSRN